MLVSGLKVGLSYEDMRFMPFGCLANIIHASNLSYSQKGKEEDVVRDATQEDIARFARS